MHLNNYITVQTNATNPSSNYNKIKLFLYKLRLLLLSLILIIFCLINLLFLWKDKIHLKHRKYIPKNTEKFSDPSINYSSTNLLFFEMLSPKKKYDNKNNSNYYKSIIRNLTAHDYYGNWSNFNTNFAKKNDFFNSKIVNGINEVFFRKLNNNILKVFTILREGKYNDKYLKFYFLFYLPQNTNNINDNQLIQTNRTLKFTNFNSKFEIAKIILLKEESVEKIDQCNITLIIYNEPYSIMLSLKKKLITQYHKIKIIFESPKFNITLDSELDSDEQLSYKVRIYNFLISVFGIIEIYEVFKLMMKLNSNFQIGINLSLVNLSINCYYKAIICVIHFFLSITNSNEDLSFEFGIPTIIYFFAFAGFELRLLVQTVRTRYIDILGTETFRLKLLFYYTGFYIVLAVILINMREILTNFKLMVFIYISFWFSQILRSLIKGTRPPLSKSYIFYNSVSKLFLPLYIKGYDGNIFNLKPSYFKVYIIVFIVFVQMIILFLQKTFGARAILPRKCRSIFFDYYRDKINLDLKLSKDPICVICLENLSADVDQNFLVRRQEKKDNKSLCYYILNCHIITIFLEKINRWMNNIEGKMAKKKYMITPCNHIFHSICLEKWIKMKNECPYCKRILPPFE